MGGHLACIENLPQQGFLTGLTQNTYTWIGATDEETEAQWKWVNGMPFKYTAWLRGAPDNSSGVQHHAVMCVGGGGWDDVAAGARLGFLCQWDKDKQVVPVIEFPWVPKSKAAADAKAKYQKAVAAARAEWVGQLQEALKEALASAQDGEVAVLRAALDRVYHPIPKLVDRRSFGTSSYKLFKEKVAWHRAKEICESMGGHLACVGTAGEQAFLKKLLGRTPEWTWLGGTSDFQEGKWQWVNGRTWKYTNWAPGQPNNGQENALRFGLVGDKWDDAWCGNRFQFICQWDK